MTAAVSRYTFEELKGYLGVHLQQGRAILDADFNEAQEIMAGLFARLQQDALGDGSPNTGFKIDPVFPPPPELLLASLDTSGMDPMEALGAIAGACIADMLMIGMYLLFGPILFFLQFPGEELDGFESLDGWALSSSQGVLRIARDRPAEGEGFLRLSGHPGTVTVTKTLDNVTDLSAYELVTFKYRMNHQTPGDIAFFVTDQDGNRSVYRHGVVALGADLWLSGFAAPLDLRFHIVTEALPAAVEGEGYEKDVVTFGGATPIAWNVSAGALPPGVALDPTTGALEGTPTAEGTFTFTLEATDADGVVAERELELEVRPAGTALPFPLPSGMEFLAEITRTEAPTGTPADLTRIAGYGFELYQDAANPLVWDLDQLRLGSSELERELGDNNFIVRGSQLSAVLHQLTMMSILMGAFDEDGNGNGNGNGNGGDDLDILGLLNTQFDLSTPSVATAGRYYVGGLPCLQVDDVLYTDEADPNDAPLAPPGPGVVRKDAVYLDVWTEDVTFVEDPAIRDVALGGPDTATRRRVRQQVRVAQGGATPVGDGIGDGTLATEGLYTGVANRLFRVEIDKAGDIGTATFRWSADNASTLARVIETVPPGSREVVVEDAAAFHVGDLVLLRKEHGAEEHVVDFVLGNRIGLVDPTGDQLALLPAATSVADFTTFALADRPSLQRWDAFGVAVEPDPADATVSKAIDLDEGVQVRFGGRAMVRGDVWTFTTRYLAGDEATGVDPVARIEQLDFRRARGVAHRYAHLATITRDGDSPEPDKIDQVEDRRLRTGTGGTVTQVLPDLLAISGTAGAHLGGMSLPASGLDSRFVILWRGDLFIDGPIPGTDDANLTLRASFFGADAPDPATSTEGLIQDRQVTLPLRRRPLDEDIPLALTFTKSDTDFAFLPISFAPASVHMFATLDLAGFSVELTNMQLTALELKRAY
jgi:hypothetical protein